MDRTTTIRAVGSTALLLPTLLVTSPAVAAKPSTAPSRVVAGAKLSEYKPPAKADCDVHVPLHYPTIQGGVDAAAAGDTVCVDPGTYNEDVRIAKPIRLAGSGPQKSVINGQTAAATVYVAGDGNADNVTVEGFLIHGAESLDENRNDLAAVNIGPFASGTVLRHNRIVAGSATLAVRMDSGQANALAYNCVFEGTSSPTLFKVVGVQGPSFKVDFVSNTFTGTVDSTTPNFSGSGVVLDTFATSSVIQRNVFDTSGNLLVLISSAYPSNVVTENNLHSSVPVKVGTYSGGTLSAENNWWGDLDPSDDVHGDVDFSPFATSPFAES